MKSVYILWTLLICSLSSFAQQQDISVFEKKDGQKNIVIARNIGKVPYKVTLIIKATGMDVFPSTKVESIVPAGFMTEMATLTPRPGEAWSYGYEVSFVESPIEGTSASSSPLSPESEKQDVVIIPEEITPESLSDAPVIVYTKPGCGRCTYVKKEMKTKGIAFEEVDITQTSPEVTDMWVQLRKAGFTGTSVTMPVVRVNGKYHYNIKDMTAFVGDIPRN